MYLKQPTPCRVRAVVAALIFPNQCLIAVSLSILGASASWRSSFSFRISGVWFPADSPSSAVRRSNTTIKIMPLGDSITESNKGLNSYRYYLWHLLLDQRYHIDFVGSQHGVGNGPPANPDFDMDHEGHAGWRADEILAQIQAWATAASPDFVLLHIGTNDLSQGQSVASTVSDIGGIIDVLRTVSPRASDPVGATNRQDRCPFHCGVEREFSRTGCRQKTGRIADRPCRSILRIRSLHDDIRWHTSQCHRGLAHGGPVVRKTRADARCVPHSTRS